MNILRRSLGLRQNFFLNAIFVARFSSVSKQRWTKTHLFSGKINNKMGEPWVIDTDGGVDDCQALVLALTHNMNLKAITTLSGNVSLAKINRNVAEVLRICNREDIPIYSGATQPLISEPYFTTAEQIMGEDGLNNYWRTHDDTEVKAVEAEPAALALLRLAKEYNGELCLATIGPLTNLALAFKLDPELPSKIKRLVVMGCAIHGKGNVTKTAEFNVWADPEAAFIVFKHFPCSEIISWELCVDKPSVLPIDYLRQYTSVDTPRGHFIRDITALKPEAASGHASNCYFCDPYAIAYALDPSVALTEEMREGTVELRGENTRGMSVINWQWSDIDWINDSKPNMKIITALDMDKVKAMLMHSVS